MKYCPYCGASILGSAVFFCAECGKELPGRKDTAHSDPRSDRQSPRPKKAQRSRKSSSSGSPVSKSQRNLSQVQDEGYDGYYDDVQPVDAGQMGEPMDPELVKRIGLLILGAVGIIILSIVLMSML